MQLSESLGDYLETIYNEISKNGEAKVTDISNVLNVKKASVTGALNLLKQKGLINYEPYSPITLTAKGIEEAKKIIEKHNIMSEFFENILNLSPAEAVENACKMEHIMSEKMFFRMMKFSIFIQEILKENPDLKEKINKLYE